MVLPFKGIMYEVSPMLTGQGTLAGGRKMQCADIELNTIECYEAYGLMRGFEKCQKFYEDLEECSKGSLAKVRYLIMKEERYKKIVKGEIPLSKRLGKPFKYDSFVPGSYIP